MDTAERAVMRAIVKRTVRKIVIRDDKAWTSLYHELQTAMTRSWSQEMRKAIADALDRLRDLGPGRFTRTDAKAIAGALEARLGAAAIAAAMREPAINLSDALYRLGATEVGKATGVDIAFMQPDFDSLDMLKQANLYWIGRSWDIETAPKIGKILREYFTQGMTREGLTARFAQDFADMGDRSRRYWEVLADHTATKTREMGRVTGYRRAGIERVEVRAHLDERTTKICRHMHGRSIEVRRLADQRDAYLRAAAAHDEAAAKRAWAMHGDMADLDHVATRDLPANTAGPPYHFRCRTITVAHFEATGPQTQVDRWTQSVRDREVLSRKEIGALIKRVKTAQWPHVKVSQGHFRKHRGRLGLSTQADYNQSALDLIRRGDRDVYLSLRKGVLNATFIKRSWRADNGDKGFIITAVDMKANKITTHHFREKLGAKNDQVPPHKQRARGVVKWLTG
ncbi:MAG: hypothetical protein V6Z86_07475 [Hyphomicrobiales bacterium]